MNQLKAAWTSLTLRRQIVAGLAAVAMFAAILGMARISGRPDYELLYSGLDATASGEVISALDAQGVSYDVRGTAIYVDQARRDELRMILAGEGLPKTTVGGYELLDSLSGFGTTSQMFDAAYWPREGGRTGPHDPCQPRRAGGAGAYLCFVGPAVRARISALGLGGGDHGRRSGDARAGEGAPLSGVGGSRRTADRQGRRHRQPVGRGPDRRRDARDQRRDEIRGVARPCAAAARGPRRPRPVDRGSRGRGRTGQRIDHRAADRP